ncbi:MAG TPA: hypothetical protein VFV34_04640 [Blastocatellia bacterium]|nr:hypothetical protein [Blastocatellia bacterium]
MKFRRPLEFPANIPAYVLLLTAALVLPTSARAQGFGSRKLITTFNQQLPPRLYLVGTAISVEVRSSDVKPRLVVAIEAELQRWLIRTNSRLKLRSSSPETLVTCDISEPKDSSSWKNRTRPEYQVVGSHMVTDPNTGAMQSVDDYGWVDVPYRAYAIDLRWTFRYSIEDVATGIVLDEDQFDAVYTKDVESQAVVLDRDEAESALGRYTVDRMLGLLGVRVDRVTAVLPVGKLQRASEILSAKQPDDALQMLVAMPRFKSLNDEAYRLYLIGVCSEASSYAAPHLNTSLKLLEDAQTNYRQATELKPAESIFWIAKNRVDYAIPAYQDAISQIGAFEESKRRLSEKLGAPDSVRQEFARTVFRDILRARTQGDQPQPVTNGTVIDWIRSGVAEDYIIASIAHAPQAQFDLSAGGQQDLKRAGATGRIIKEMQRYGRQGTHSPSTGLRIATTAASLLLIVLPMIVR